MALHSGLVGADLHGAKLSTGSGSPSGAITPGVVGEAYYDLTNHQEWIANGLTNTSWEKASSTAVNDKGSTTYAGSAPVYAEANALLPAVGNYGWFRKGNTDSVYAAFRRSTAAGTLADFGIVELT